MSGPEKLQNLFVGYNTPADDRNLSDLEKKHLPMIDAPDTVTGDEPFDVTVEVGRLLAHPNEHNHFIQFIDLYADDTFLARCDFASARSWPKATLRVSLSTPAERLRAFAHCNLHGTWMGEKQIEVLDGPAKG